MKNRQLEQWEMDTILACKHWYNNENENTIVGLDKTIQHIAEIEIGYINNDIRATWLYRVLDNLIELNVLRKNVFLDYFTDQFPYNNMTKTEFMMSAIGGCISSNLDLILNKNLCSKEKYER